MNGCSIIGLPYRDSLVALEIKAMLQAAVSCI